MGGQGDNFPCKTLHMLNFLADAGLAERACLVGGIENEKAIFAVTLDDALLQTAKHEDFSAAFHA